MHDDDTGFEPAGADAPLVDFTSGAVAHRLKFGGGKGQPIARALGFKPGQEMHVVDATAGLGRDSFVFASLGAHVTLIERSPEMHAALEQALEKAREVGGIYAEIAARMTLLHGDSKDLLPALAPDVIYVDPMHPPRKTTALVKKNLKQVRALVGADEDSAELMRVALAAAQKRVVLKWPRKADQMAGIRAPSHQIIGKSTRYDVYMTFAAPKAEG